MSLPTGKRLSELLVDTKTSDPWKNATSYMEIDIDDIETTPGDAADVKAGILAEFKEKLRSKK